MLALILLVSAMSSYVPAAEMDSPAMESLNEVAQDDSIIEDADVIDDMSEVWEDDESESYLPSG